MIVKYELENDNRFSYLVVLPRYKNIKYGDNLLIHQPCLLFITLSTLEWTIPVSILMDFPLFFVHQF